MSFQPLPDRDLDRLGDDELIGYIRTARDGGELDAARRALTFLVFGYERNVKGRLRLRVPEHAVDDLTHDALVRAITAAFDGHSAGEFRSWLHTIVDRAVADYYRHQRRRPQEVAFPSEHGDEEGIWRAEPSVDGEAEAVELRIIVEQVLAGLSEKHRQVIDLHVFTGLTGPEVAARVADVSEANVAQIASRFRARLRDRLDPDAGGGS